MNKDLIARIVTLRARIDDAWRVLDLETRRQEIVALETESAAPDFWSEPERAKDELQKLSELKKEFEAWSALKSETDEAQELTELVDDSLEADLVKKIGDLEKRYLDLEFTMLFSGKYDSSNAVVSVHAGAGGTDAQDWAEILLRMFIRYAEKKNWKTRLVDESRGGEAGIKSATFFVEGRYAYGHLKGEAGVHRLVRQSPFNSDALRQTSFALVEVVPEIDESVDIEIRAEDLRVDTFMSGGKGGQSVNTTYSAVRIVHLPTKITVSCQNERSQTQNKETAMKILRGKLVALKEAELQKEKDKLRGEFHSAEWGNQIRSYVIHPYKMVKDHRTEVETSDTEAVLNGELDLFIEGYLRKEAEKRDVKAELNED